MSRTGTMVAACVLLACSRTPPAAVQPPPRGAPAGGPGEVRGGRRPPDDALLRKRNPVPLSAEEGRAFVRGRTAITNATFAEAWLAESFDPDAAAMARTDRFADRALLSVLGLASWDGVDASAPIRLYHTDSDRYFAPPDFAVVGKLGSEMPSPAPGRVVLDLGTHAAIDREDAQHRLIELKAFLVADLERPLPPDPFHIEWRSSDEEARPLPVGLLQLLEFDDRDAVRNGRANQFRCLRKPSDDPANEDRFRRDSEALLAQRWWLAEETAWVRCFGRGRTFDTTDCSAYHVDNFRDVLVVDNPARDLSMSTRMILDALGAREGMRIVDVGAGMGYFTFKLAGTIGETGKVFALDTAPCAVRYIRTAMVGRGVSNVEVSLVSDTVVKFPFQDIDAFIFINTPCWSGNLSRRVYYLDMYRRMAAALRPGGKVVIWSAGRNISDAGIDPLDPREIAEAMKLADLHLVNSTSVAEYASEDTGTPFLLVLRKPGSD